MYVYSCLYYIHVYLCIPVLTYLRMHTSYNTKIKDVMLVIAAQIPETHLGAVQHMPTAGSQVQSFGLPNSPQDFMTFHIHSGCLNLVKSCGLSWLLASGDGRLQIRSSGGPLSASL